MKQVSLLRKPIAFEGRFTQIPNAWARDERIGYRAKGILLLLMSHQDGWRITLEHLVDGPDGISAIRTAIQQLEQAGYLQRSLLRDNKNRVEGSEWVISDPFEIADENLILENLKSENLKSENQRHKNTNIKENQVKENYIEAFESFWSFYPRKTGKGSARTAFEKALKKTTADELLAAVEVYSKSNLPEPQFIPHPATWLNQERWADDMTLTNNKTATTIAEDIIRRSMALDQKALD